jgi:hypothetical protein
MTDTAGGVPSFIFSLCRVPWKKGIVVDFPNEIKTREMFVVEIVLLSPTVKKGDGNNLEERSSSRWRY